MQYSPAYFTQHFKFHPCINSSLFYGYCMTRQHFIYRSFKWTFGLLPLATDKNKVIVARIVKVFLCEHVVLLRMHLEMNLTGQVVTVFNFLRNCQIFSPATPPFYPHQQQVEVMISAHPLALLTSLVFPEGFQDQHEHFNFCKQESQQRLH